MNTMKNIIDDLHKTYGDLKAEERELLTRFKESSQYKFEVESVFVDILNDITNSLRKIEILQKYFYE